MLCLDHWVLWSDSISDILLWHCHSIKTHFLLTSSDFGGPEEFEGQLTFNMNHAVIAPFSSPAYKLEMANRVSPSKRSFHVFRSCSTSPPAPPQLQQCVCVCVCVCGGFSVCECMGRNRWPGNVLQHHDVAVSLTFVWLSHFWKTLWRQMKTVACFFLKIW